MLAQKLVILSKLKMNEPIFTSTTRGTHLLHVGSFTFRRTKQNSSREYWSCEESCGATCITEARHIVFLSSDHSHPPNQIGVHRKIIIEKIKQVTLQDNGASLRDAYNKVMHELMMGSTEEQSMAGNYWFVND